MDLSDFGDKVDGASAGHAPAHALVAPESDREIPGLTTEVDASPVAEESDTILPQLSLPPEQPPLDGVPPPPKLPPTPPAAPVAQPTAPPQGTLPVPTHGATAGAHPVHMPFEAAGPLTLPDRRLLTPPQEPVWHAPFSEPEPRLFGGLGARQHELWESRRDNHEDMCRRQREEHSNAVNMHHAATEQVRNVMAGVQRQLFEAARGGRVSRVFAPAHSKGGVGKTPSATAIAAVCGQATRQPVFLVDANPYMGGAAARSGVERAGLLTVTDLIRHHREMTMHDILAATYPTEYGVFTIASDHRAVREPDPVEFTAMIESLKRLSPIIVIDTGNNIGGELNRAIFRLSSALVFPMLTAWGHHTTNGPVDDLIGTKNMLELMAQEDPQDRCFTAKTRLGVTVALGLRPDQSEREFRIAAGQQGLMLTVPWDDTAATPQPLVLPTKEGILTPIKGVIDPYTAVAWAKVALACFQQAEEYDNHVASHTPKPTQSIPPPAGGTHERNNQP